MTVPFMRVAPTFDMRAAPGLPGDVLSMEGLNAAFTGRNVEVMDIFTDP